MNKALFIGNLTKDPETKVMNNGKPRCTFTLAVQRKFKNDDGSREADFIQIVAYDARAELVQKYLEKGRKALCECHVRTGSYEKDDGNGGKARVYTTDFVLDEVEFLSSGSQNTNAQSANRQNQPESGTQDEPQSYGGDFTPVQDDDLPF